MPLAYPSTLDRRRPGSTSSYVEELWSPKPLARSEIRRLKPTLIRSVNFRLARRGSFSLRRGLDSVLCLLQAGHHPSVGFDLRLRNDEGDPAGSPSREAAIRSSTSGRTSARGRSARRSGARRRRGSREAKAWRRSPLWPGTDACRWSSAWCVPERTIDETAIQRKMQFGIFTESAKSSYEMSRSCCVYWYAPRAKSVPSACRRLSRPWSTRPPARDQRSSWPGTAV